MTAWAFIPAKGHSRRLPGKNLRRVGGVTLVSRAVGVALESGLFARVIVSTDSGPVALESTLAGAEIHSREQSCCLDQESGHVVAHWLADVPEPPDVVALLLPTAPLRTAEHLQDSLCLLADLSAEVVMSVTPITQDFRYALTVTPERRLQRAVSEWRLPPGPYWVHDGTVLWVRRGRALTGAFYGPDVVPYYVPTEESCDVNTAVDLERARAMLGAAV